MRLATIAKWTLLSFCIAGAAVLGPRVHAGEAAAQRLGRNGSPPSLSRAAIDELMQEMASQGAKFPPERLLALGVSGLNAVLDAVFPETAPIEEMEEEPTIVAELRKELRDDNYQVREAATERLLRMGPSSRKLAMLLAADDDAEVSWRAVRVLRAWDDQRRDDMARYAAALTVCLAKIEDPPRLELLCDRVRRALEVGAYNGGKGVILRQAVFTLFAVEDDRYFDPLKPLFEKSPRGAELVIQWIGQAVAVRRNAGKGDAQATGSRVSAGRSSESEPIFIPGILLTALQSERQQLVLTALQAVPLRVKGPHGPELRRLLEKLFAEGNDTLKIRASRPLVGVFGYEPAYDYLLDQAAQRENAGRRHEALGVLAQIGDGRRPLTAKAGEVLPTLLHDRELGHARLLVATTLSKHSSRKVVESLVSVLADDYPPLAQEAGKLLLEYPDRNEVRDCLEQAARNTDKKLKEAAEQLVKRLDQQEQ